MFTVLAAAGCFRMFSLMDTLHFTYHGGVSHLNSETADLGSTVCYLAPGNKPFPPELCMCARNSYCDL